MLRFEPQRVGGLHDVIADSDPAGVVIRDDSVGPDPHPESDVAGLGWPLIERLADRFELEPETWVGTTVRMRFTLSGNARSSIFGRRRVAGSVSDTVHA